MAQSRADSKDKVFEHMFWVIHVVQMCVPEKLGIQYGHNGVFSCIQWKQIFNRYTLYNIKLASKLALWSYVVHNIKVLNKNYNN